MRPTGGFCAWEILGSSRRNHKVERTGNLLMFHGRYRPWNALNAARLMAQSVSALRNVLERREGASSLAFCQRDARSCPSIVT
jgi:hypothetical protein